MPAVVGEPVLYQCPKEGNVDLQEEALSPGLPSHTCPSCGGAWIQPEHYAVWQSQQVDTDAPTEVSVLPLTLDTDFQTPSLDNRAALCPDCRSYLVRGRVNLSQRSFFVERCPNCKGIWCDAGEWDLLQKLNLHTHVEYLFSPEWQNQVRELENLERERRATIEKLGPDIAERVFELAELLEKHPNGDFGVAYLMRRFDQ